MFLGVGPKYLAVKKVRNLRVLGNLEVKKVGYLRGFVAVLFGGGVCVMDVSVPPTNYPKSLSSIIKCHRRRAAINNCHSVVSHPPLSHSNHHHRSLRVRSSAAVAPPLPPPLVVPMTTPKPSPTIRRLDVASPVPADIDIANAVSPLPIADIAAELGLRPEHFDLYGKYKAKVRAPLPKMRIGLSRDAIRFVDDFFFRLFFFAGVAVCS